MNLLCKLFKHKWDGCKCTRCGIVRDEDHDFGYTCICAICGLTIDQFHCFNGTCRCIDCGKVIDENHIFIDGKCIRCGKTQS